MDMDPIGFLAQGANWKCAECLRSYDGCIGTRPPGIAPPRWCKGCKRTRKLALATCAGCTLTWNQCRCPGEQQGRMQMMAVKPIAIVMQGNPVGATPRLWRTPEGRDQAKADTREEGKGVGATPKTPDTEPQSTANAAKAPNSDVTEKREERKGVGTTPNTQINGHPPSVANAVERHRTAPRRFTGSGSTVAPCAPFTR